MNIEQNVEHRFGSAGYFDVIYIFGSFSTQEIRSASRYSPIMMREDECWGYRCLPSIINNNISIFLQKYAYEIDLYHKSFSYNRVLVHSPASAEPLIFYTPIVLNSDTPPIRDIDVLVVGARHSFVYPIRTRLGQMIKDGLIKNSYVHEHPGYTLFNNLLEQTEEQTRMYAALLRRAKIVVVDSARYGYALSKFIEVPLSGCLVLGDIPAEREDEFRQFIVEISMNMPDNEIISIIDYWITHEGEREIKANLGQRITLDSHTWDHSIDVSLQALISYQRRHFGIYHRYAYTMKCVPIDNSDRQSSVSRWCPEKVTNELFSMICECNQTGINYFDSELDLDHWKSKGCDINATNPRMYLVPSGLLAACDSYETIRDMVDGSLHGSLCYCPDLEKTWRGSNICYVQNTALTISRYLACFRSQ